MTESAFAQRRQRDDGKLFSKYKWRGKIFSNDEALAKETNQKFNLDEDVVDFLKPSTSKAAAFASKAPRLDVAAAQRWPDAADLGRGSPRGGTPSSMAGRTQGRVRRLNLKVGFVKAAPEIIGEGGDEAELPAIEVSRTRRAAPPGSAMGRQGASYDDSAVALHRMEQGLDMAGGPRPGSIKRAQNSYAGITPPLHQREEWDTQSRAQTVAQQAPPFRPAPLKRAPTGWQGDENGQGRPSTDEDDEEKHFRPKPISRTQTGWSEHTMAPDRPSLDVESSSQSSFMEIPSGNVVTRALEEQPPRLPEMRSVLSDSPTNVAEHLGHFLQSEPSNPDSFAARIQHKMRAEEGRALHEAAQNHSSQVFEDSSRPSTSASSSYIPQSMQLSQPRPSVSKSPSYFASATQRRPLASSGSPFSDPCPQPRPISSSSSSSATQPIPITSNRSSATARRPIPSPLMFPAPGSSSYSSSPQPTPLPGLPPPSTPNYFGLPSATPEQPMSLPRPRPDRGPSTQAYDPAISRTNIGPIGDAAMEDFADRVTHMRAVFRLMADVERPSSTYTPLQWLRAGIWWFLKGRAGIEILIRSRPRGPDDRPLSFQHEQPLSQPHVDLAKTWWIVCEVLPAHPALEAYGDYSLGARAAAARHAGDYAAADVLESCETITTNLKMLLSSMSRNHAMPPHQSLIQGQDQSIWVKHPNFAPDVQSAVSGTGSRSLTITEPIRKLNPLSVMPLADDRDNFCYARMFVQVSLATEDQETDRVALPCILSIMRPRNGWQLEVTICSQTDLVTTRISSDRKFGPTWDDVSWRTRLRGLYVQLPRGFTLNVEFAEKDYEQLWSIYDHTRKAEASLLPKENETLVHDVSLRDFQYSDSASPPAFPPERIKRCRARIFQQTAVRNEGTGQRRLHRGYRFLVVTSPKHRILGHVSHDFSMHNPINFELRDDSDGDGAPAMIFRVQEEKRRCTMSLTFNHPDERNVLYCVLNGVGAGPDESLYAQVPLKSLSIEQLNQAEGFVQSGHDPLRRMQWRDVQVINKGADSPGADTPRTILSEHLRVVSTCRSGAVTDRMNLSPGELRIRLDVSGKPELRLLRPPQDDMTMSIDPSRTEPKIPEALAELLRTIMESSTIRTYSFESLQDLHNFQTSITGFRVKFDGVAATFAISRRRMVVPIYKHWTASPARLQIVQRANTLQLLAFFADFSHADSMVLQLRSTDVFERVDKGGKAFGVRLVDAKFTLPAREGGGKGKEGKEGGSERGKNVEEGYVCLDSPEYAGEHDDITVGFESEADRDRFLEALPAAPQVSRSITFKRKI